MKQLLQFTKETLPKVITQVKPEKPHPNACCGCGCGEECVWVPYYKAIKEYESYIDDNLKNKKEKQT